MPNRTAQKRVADWLESAEHVLLGDVLCGPHHIGRSHRLVGGDEHESLGSELVGQVRHAPGAEHVVLDRLAGIGFHQRHVFVGGGVKDHLRLKLLEDSPHSLAIGHIGNAGAQRRGAIHGAELAFDLEHAVLTAADEHEAFGVESQDLAADFRANASAGSGNQDGAALERSPDGVGIQLDRFPPQKVVDFQTAHGNLRIAVESVLQGRDELEGKMGMAASVHERAELFARENARGSQDVRDSVVGGNVADVAYVAEDGKLSQLPLVGGAVRGQQPYDPVGESGLRLDLMGKHAGDVIGSHQKRESAQLGVEKGPQVFAKDSPTAPQDPQSQDHQRAVEHQHRARDGRTCEKEVQRGNRQQCD